MKNYISYRPESLTIFKVTYPDKNLVLTYSPFQIVPFSSSLGRITVPIFILQKVIDILWSLIGCKVHQRCSLFGGGCVGVSMLHISRRNNLWDQEDRMDSYCEFLKNFIKVRIMWRVILRNFQIIWKWSSLLLWKLSD